MIITKKALPRRTFLRGMGATLALPLLDAMIPSMTALADTPANPARLRRLGFVYMPMGCDITRWTPPGEKSLHELSPSLSSLAPVKQHVTVITNMELQNAYPGTHATSNAAFLSAAKAKRTESADYYLGTTVDQIAAQQIGQETQLPSLEMSMDLLSVVGQCDNGYACVYQNHLSWSSPETPLPAEAHPRMIFETLFGEGGSMADRTVALEKRASLLDSVTEEITRLQNKLGPNDRNKVNQYLETIREVERRIQQASANTTENPLPDLDRPVGVPATYADHARLMFDLQVLALQGDITRVITFQLARETSNRTYPEIDVSNITAIRLFDIAFLEIDLHPKRKPSGNVELLLVVKPEPCIHRPVFRSGIRHSHDGCIPKVFSLNQFVPSLARRVLLSGHRSSQTPHDDGPSFHVSYHLNRPKLVSVRSGHTVS